VPQSCLLGRFAGGLALSLLEDEPAAYQGHSIPSVSAWAFGGAHPGETSELFDDETGYYLARLDSIAQGGDPKFENVKPLVRQEVARTRALDALAPKAQKLMFRQEALDRIARQRQLYFAKIATYAKST